MVMIERESVSYFMDDRLDGNISKIEERVKEKDEDCFWIVDGPEGGGKSVFAFQLAKRVDPSFNLSRVVFNAKEFHDSILKAGKGEAIVFDEAFRGLSSRNALGEVNKVLVKLMMECRQKNLFIIIVIPTIFLLDRYVILWRAKGLFHIYRKKGKRGYWVYFNEKKKKLLYLKGKMTYSYKSPRTNFHGRFYDVYAVDEKEYRKKKMKELMSIDKSVSAQNYLEQRNALLWLCVKEAGINTVALSQRLESLGIRLAQNTISETVVKKEEEWRKKGLLL